MNHQVISDMTCQLGTEQSRPERRHRVVSFQDNNGSLIKVATHLYSLPAETINCGNIQSMLANRDFFC